MRKQQACGAGNDRCPGQHDDCSRHNGRASRRNDRCAGDDCSNGEGNGCGAVYASAPDHPSTAAGH